jgi:hypothetical protein
MSRTYTLQDKKFRVCKPAHLVGRGRPEWADHDQQHCYHHVPTVKPEGATAVDKLLMMGMRMPETCCAVFKRQAIKLRDRCIWLVDLFEDKKCSICSINPRYI